MKKILVVGICWLASTVAMAGFECAYSPLQIRISKARSRDDIQVWIDKGVTIEEDVKCGGSLLQLAIRRGVPGVLDAILDQDPQRANNIENLDAFPIPGVTGQIPVLLFAAYYAPNKEIVQSLLDAGADIAATDNEGRNVLWYMQFNPVLKNTSLYDSLNNKILESLAKRSMPSVGGTARVIKKRSDSLINQED